MNYVGRLSLLLIAITCNGKIIYLEVGEEASYNVDIILRKYREYGVFDLRQQAYILATTGHESYLRPIEERGKGKGKPYGELDPETGEMYYGRGFVQLTWKYNYLKFSKILGEKRVYISTPHAILYLVKYST